MPFGLPVPAVAVVCFVPIEPMNQILEKWFSAIGTSAAGATKDLNLYLEQIGKIEQAEMVSEVDGPSCTRSPHINHPKMSRVLRSLVQWCSATVGGRGGECR